MAYREVRMMDIDQVIRRWLAGEKVRAIARLTGSDRNTVRRIVRLAEEVGIRAGTPWPEEGKLQAIRQRMGRPGAVTDSINHYQPAHAWEIGLFAPTATKC